MTRETQRLASTEDKVGRYIHRPSYNRALLFGGVFATLYLDTSAKEWKTITTRQLKL